MANFGPGQHREFGRMLDFRTLGPPTPESAHSNERGLAIRGGLLCFGPDNVLLAAVADHVHAYTADGRHQATYEAGRHRRKDGTVSLRSVTVSGEMDNLLAGSHDGRLFSWSLSSGSLVDERRIA